MGMKKKCGMAILVIAALLLTRNGHAGIAPPYIWIAENEADWHESQNWNQGAVPGAGGAGDRAEIGSLGGGTAVISRPVPTILRWSIMGGVVPGSVDIRAGGLLTTTGEVANEIGRSGDASLRMSGGRLSMTSHLDLWHAEVIQTGGTIELTNETEGFVSLFGGLLPGETTRWQTSAEATLEVATHMTVGLFGRAELIQRGGHVNIGDLLIVSSPGSVGRSSLSLELTSTLNVGTAIQIGDNGKMQIVGNLTTINTNGFIMRPGADLQMTVVNSVSTIQAGWTKLAGNLDISQFIPAEVGDTLTLISNRGDAAVDGTFTDKPQGSMIDVNGTNMQITYQANVDGGSIANDVVLTVLPEVLHPGDLNFDGRTDRHDLFAMSQSYGKQDGAIWTDGDVDLDGSVLLADLARLRRQFHIDGSASPASAVTVPEPSGVMLIVIGALLVVGSRRSSRA